MSVPTQVEFPVFNLHVADQDFGDLPWHLPLGRWEGVCTRLEEVQRGLSRHPVVFVNYSGKLFALKELPPGLAEHEYQLLVKMEEQRLPRVTPVGWVDTYTSLGRASVLVTDYLEHSLPYRTLFQRGPLQRYRQGLLDAIAGLMVQLHLAGMYWGDCSLSNTLFRRDDGALQAYLVDAETAEFYHGRVPPQARYQDLEIMDENITGDLADIESVNILVQNVPLRDTGAYIRLRYGRLWEEITQEVLIAPHERFRIQERVRALNDLGYSVGDIELAQTQDGDQLRMRVVVTDRFFHRDQLHNLTGLDAEELQARKMMNEIQELKATLSKTNNRSTPLSVAAYHWMDTVYQPVSDQLRSLPDRVINLTELYCQVLEHKWYLSEKAQRDVGHLAAVQDFLTTIKGVQGS